ncbi:spherulation-specific family 4 protein [Raineyella sp.]|uniref:Spherulation-specific family 4 n=1 Tax=bioreactor metagenome TaxID=1076179 RepID=A0A644Z4W4_9ZZZZ|nr:spherulation-specific family 4 protein [Raineyella sp.]MEA5154280.1 spherulation-specific family 4 protein [Raineyella sp.]
MSTYVDLTEPSRTRGRTRLRAAAPWYVHPLEAPAAWERLRAGRAGLAFAVVNVSDGPGPATDGCYREALTGVATPLLGYVDVAYGRRSADAILADLAAWQDRYAISAVMLDRVPPRASGRWRLGVIDRLRAAGAVAVVVNPGCPAPADLLHRADVTCVVEEAWPQYRSRPVPPAGVPPARVWHLVHACPPEQQPAAHALAEAAGAGLCWTTAGRLPNPWRTLQEDQWDR